MYYVRPRLRSCLQQGSLCPVQICEAARSTGRLTTLIPTDQCLLGICSDLVDIEFSSPLQAGGVLKAYMRTERAH